MAAESLDSFYLILFLTFFAVFASSYVVHFAINSTNITSFRIILQAINIITSTIPPDLPMELTLSVNNSLLALSKLWVFCTEPFRIPFAGTVSVCCFDKTGTLTEEEYVFQCIDDMNKGNEFETSLVVGGCHSLVKVGNQLIGDSLEIAAFNALNFIYAGKNIKNKTVNLSIQKIFHFSAEKRRMSTIVNVPSSKQLYALTKGAPEVVAEFLEIIPGNYFSKIS